MCAVAAVVLALNFTTGETKIEQRIERLYGVEDPDFLRSMGVLLGPAIVTGNGFEVLLNGDRIFPSMLQAIGSARRPSSGISCERPRVLGTAHTCPTRSIKMATLVTQLFA